MADVIDPPTWIRQSMHRRISPIELIAREQMSLHSKASFGVGAPFGTTRCAIAIQEGFLNEQS